MFGNPNSPKSKSFLFECREASRYCMDRELAHALRAATDDLSDAVSLFTVAVTAESLVTVNSQWMRCHVLYNQCKMAQPPGPGAGKIKLVAPAITEAQALKVA